MAVAIGFCIAIAAPFILAGVSSLIERIVEPASD